MIDVTTLSHDELVALGKAILTEGEARLDAAGYKGEKKKVAAAHASILKAIGPAIAAGHVSTKSAGGPKPPQ